MYDGYKLLGLHEWIAVRSVPTRLETLKGPTVHLLWNGDVPGTGGFCKMIVVNFI